MNKPFQQFFSFVAITVACVAIARSQLPPVIDRPTVENLTEAEFAALERATEASVTGTISFLASDELAGRGTPSKELTIATAYVASRLRAAGARGLGPEGSYYLESQVDTVLVPNSNDCVQSVGAARQPKCTVFNSLDQAYEHSGRIKLMASNDSAVVENKAPVASRLPDSNRPAMAALMVEYRTAIKSGAGALCLLVSETSELWQRATDRQLTETMESPRRRLQIPIILMEASDFDAHADYRLEVPANIPRKAVVRNVVGILPGSDPQLADEAIIFSAHLDHLGSVSAQTDPIYNGADDDASGVTAVLTLADIFGALVPHTKRSLIFVTFWGEERGLLGSKAFVADSPWSLEHVVANVNIEMIGRPEPGAIHRMWMTGWNQSNLGELVAMGSRRLGVETFEHPSFSARLYRASDNASFVNQGVIAHSFSAGSIHADYHQPSDEWQKLNLPHMTQVIRGLYAGTLSIANGQFTPSSN